jgi:phosphate butyryltransferase
MPPIKNLAQLTAVAQQHGPLTLAVAAAHELHVLEAVRAATDAGMVRPILIGNELQMQRIAAEHGISLDGFTLVNADEIHEAAAMAVRLVHDGDAQVLMKGRLETADLIRAVLNKLYGLRTEALLSMVWVAQLPGMDRLIFLSDAGIVIKPTLDQKAEIVQNTINAARQLGLEEPKVAVLAALDMVSPAISATVDAANLSKMADRGQIIGGYVDGPLCFDTAISPAAAAAHGLGGRVAGHADILIVPDIEAGNVLAKGLVYFAHAESASVVVGASAPIIISSRADSAATKLASIALGVVLATAAPPPAVALEYNIAQVQQQ